MRTLTVEKILCFQTLQLQYLKLYDIGYTDRTGVPEMPPCQSRSRPALYYTCSGRGKLFLNNQQFLIKKGDLFYVPAGDQVEIISSSEEPLAYYWMSFYPAYAGEIQESLGFCESKPIRPARSALRVLQILTDLFQANTPTSEVYFLALSSLMQILASEFIDSDTNYNNTRNQELVTETKRIIELNYTDNSFAIQDAANSLHINHPQMTRIFKEITGKTPVSYLLDLRLSHAAELLKTKPLSVSELCDASGFSNECHFMKQFKKKYGITVKEYRHQYSTNQTDETDLSLTNK